jgi:hypothetical protein
MDITNSLETSLITWQYRRHISGHSSADQPFGRTGYVPTSHYMNLKLRTDHNLLFAASQLCLCLLPVPAIIMWRLKWGDGDIRLGRGEEISRSL